MLSHIVISHLLFGHSKLSYNISLEYLLNHREDSVVTESKIKRMEMSVVMSVYV